MAIIAGFYLPEQQGHWVKQTQWQTIKQKIISKLGADSTNQLFHFETSQCLLLKVEVGCHNNKAWYQDDASLSTCIGHPLLSANRQIDCMRLNKYQGITATLNQCQGSFALAQFDKQHDQLLLTSDSLALRPFHYLQHGDGWIFSTNLTLLNQLELGLTNNADALISIAMLGYPHSDDSAFAQVKTLRPGQTLKFTNNGLTKDYYHQWSQRLPNQQSMTLGVDQLTDAFDKAMDLYGNNDQSFVSTLSGGLDSRVIAAHLAQQGKQINCINFSQHASQDLLYAKAFAQANGIPLRIVQCKNTQLNSVENKLGALIHSQDFDPVSPAQRPNLVWSGNGGSVCLGQVYTSQHLLKALQSYDLERIADAYIEQQQAYVPKSILAHANDAQHNLKHAIIASLSEYKDLPILKAWQLYLWENDQHHHVWQAMESVLDFKLDFHLPFYAKGVLEAAFSVPTELLLWHTFYMQWMKSRYPTALDTPWQSYPEHISSKKAIAAPDQWAIAKQHKVNPQWLNNSVKALLADKQGRYNKLPLSLLCLAQALGIKNCASQLKTVATMENWRAI